MDSDSWARFSTSASSNRNQFRSDPYDDEEIEIDDGSRQEFLCPFCAEDFDMVGLCCHLDEDHMLEVKNGVCPVCAKKVGMDLVGHIIMQHGSLLKNKRRFRKGGSTSTLAILRKDLREGNLQSLHGGSYIISTNNTDADPLLSSFMGNPPVKDEPKYVEPHSSDLVCSVEDDLLEDSLERSTPQPSPLSDKDQEEKARRCEFVQGLVMSTFLDDIL